MARRQPTTAAELAERANPDNPRIITEDQLRMLGDSLEQFGDLSGLWLNRRTGKMGGGHQRVKLLGDAPITITRTYRKPTKRGTVAEGYVDKDGERYTYRVVDWDEQTEKMAMIAANKHGGSWDDAKLRELLGEMKVAGADMHLTGFDPTELERMLAENPKAVVDAEPRVGEAEILQKKWGTKRGQRWLLGKHVLLCGDATDKADVEKLLAGDKPGIMVTDPPYGVNYSPTWRLKIRPAKSTLKMGAVPNDDRCDWTPAWKLFPGDVAYVWHGAVHAAEVQTSLEAAGFNIRNQIIWAKDRLVIGRGDYHWKHEAALYAVKAGRSAQRAREDEDYAPGHEPAWYAVKNGKPAKRTDDRSQTTLWEIPAREDKGHGHGTQKPTECMLRPIRNHEFKLIYEPFAGSGTTIIAAEQIGRECRAMELFPPYVAVILQRWLDATGQTPRLDR